MGFEIINIIKKEQGLTNAQIAQMSGITLSTLDKITSGVNKNPKLDTLQAICKVLGCTLNDFMDSPQKNKEPPPYSGEAMKLAQDYDCLDKWGRKQVRDVADNEIARCKADRQARVAELLKESREEVDLAEKMPTLVSKSGLEAEKKKLMEALDKFSPVQLQMYFDQMRKLSGLQIEASPAFVPPEDAQKVLGPDSSAPPL